MSLQYPNGFCMPPPNIVCFYHHDTNLRELPK
jgi:hypothetical protein